MSAAAKGHADCARLLLDAGADKDAKDMVHVISRCSLFFNCNFHLYYCLSRYFLISNGTMIIFDMSPYSSTWVLYLCSVSQFNLWNVSHVPLAYFCAIAFLFCGDVESDLQGGWTALICAAFNGRVDCARLLIDAGADKGALTAVR